jgi:putative ABC transport system permease protein
MSKTSPPELFLCFFRWYCHPKMLDYIEGDLMEVYERRVKESGKRIADTRFIVDVLLLFRPGIIRPAEGYKNLNTYGMFKSYFKIGWRNLSKDKMFSFINVSGLSLGLTCSVLIGLWIRDEVNMDAFHKNSDRLFAVIGVEYSGSEVNGDYFTTGLLGEELKKVVPEVEYACNKASRWHNFAAGDKKMIVPGNFAGADFFKMFSYPLVIGSKETALKSKDGIVLSKRMAIVLFGSAELAINQSVRYENKTDLKVTAVFEDLQNNSSEKFEYLMNWEFFLEENEWMKNWHSTSGSTFVMLREHANPEIVKSKIQYFIKNYDSEYSDLDRLELGLQPYKEKYLHSNFKNGQLSGGRIEYVQLFRLVAIFILLIACINFMNLSTARSIKRAKEIGVRKVNGAMRTALISQFMTEAFMVTFVAIVFSLFLLSLVLPQFNLLTGKNIHYPVLDGEFWIGIASLTFLTSIISGSYPAFMLSSFMPINVLKSSSRINSSSVFFRKGMVIVQFMLAVIFIVGMIVISSQVNFVQNKNLGYQKSNLIYLQLRGSLYNNFKTFRDELLRLPGISEITRMNARPVELDNTTTSVNWEGKLPNTLPNFVQAAVDYNFVKTMQSALVLGRDFSEDFADSANYIINETAWRVIGYKDPIGMPLTFWGKKGTIVGVVKDFHFNSLHVPIKPLVIRLNTGNYGGYALIRMAPGQTQTALAGMEALHEKLNPEFLFANQFADEEYAFLYQSEHVVKKLSTYFAFLAVFISCLGLLGLVMFTAQQRVKEIGVRKVLGASVTQIVSLLSQDFLMLVCISILVAIPVAYYVMFNWLQGFEYHVDLQWWFFIVAAAGALFIAFATVSFQAIKAGRANPVNSLRSE